MKYILCKKKDKDLYNVYSTETHRYLYKWNNKKIISTHIYSLFQKEARIAANNFINNEYREV